MCRGYKGLSEMKSFDGSDSGGWVAPVVGANKKYGTYHPQNFTNLRNSLTFLQFNEFDNGPAIKRLQESYKNFIKFREVLKP